LRGCSAQSLLVNKLAGDMAPKAGKAKPHKAKGDRKKKEEKGAAN
jgi:hypothetical protein